MSVSSMHVVLVEPQIAPNTGNIIRLCANTGAALHLVEPLGFEFGDARLRRGGLDYHEFANVTIHPDIEAARTVLRGRWFAFSAAGTHRYTDVEYGPDDVLMFGTERTGLSGEVLAELDPEHLLTIPMTPDNRSLNLGNAAAIVVYEAWRQTGFAGAAAPRRGNVEMTAEALTAEPYDR